MSFDLRIHFIGLEMFVPEDDRAMHVLLPAVHHDHGGGAGGAHHEVEEHFSRIVFDSAYTQPGQTEFKREYTFIDFTSRLLDLRGLKTSGRFVPALTHELASMDRVAEPVKPERVTELPDATLAGRVSMDSGALTDYSLGALFTLNGGKPQRMALETEWTIRGIQSAKPRAEGGAEFLPGRPLPAADGSNVDLPDLFPIGDTIHLMVFNAVRAVFPPGAAKFAIPAAEQNDSDHFVAYYGICDKRPEVTETASTPTPAGEEEVHVTGPFVKNTGEETPSLGCVQTQGRLG